jgi:hypothetical protein
MQYMTGHGPVRVNSREAHLLTLGARGLLSPDRLDAYGQLKAACERVAKFKDGIRD